MGKLAVVATVSSIPFVATLGLLSFASIGSFSSFKAVANTCGPSPVQTGSANTVKRKPIVPEQLLNAQIIIGVGKKRGFSRRDVKIALMVSTQESSLINLPYGDEDSLGLFQQRPSQGWGTPDQIMDPVYATNKFYDALSGVKDRDKLSLLEVALLVQKPRRSAYESPANRFNDQPSLEGCSYGKVLGIFSDPGPGPQDPSNGNLVPRAANLRLAIMNTWGCDKLKAEPCVREIGGYSVRPANTPQDHTFGLALDVTIGRLKSYPDATYVAFGWQIACTLEANAEKAGLRYFIWQGKIWNITRRNEGGPGLCGGTGWRPYTLATDVTGGHYDHIHITVQPGVGG